MRIVSSSIASVLLFAFLQATGCNSQNSAAPPESPRACSRPEGPVVRAGSGRICDALGFCWASPWPQGNHLTGVWVSPTDEVWTVAATGSILRFDGSTWSVSANIPGAELYAIWGRDARDIWTVGSGGTIYHFDGTTWTPSQSGTGVSLADIWGSGARDVWAVGAQGTLLHFDGATWAPVPTGTQMSLYAIWGSAADDLWVGGELATLLHWDGMQFTSRLSLGGANEDWPAITSIAGTAPDNVWFGGANWRYGTVLHWDGQELSWPDNKWPHFIGFEAIYSVFSTGPGDVIAVGQYGGAYHFDGAEWGPLNTSIKSSLNSLHGDASGNAWAVGNDGAILSLRGCVWTSIVKRPLGGSAYVLAVNADDDVWALGTSVFHFDGRDWREFAIGTTAPMFVAWTSGANDVWAGGASGTLIHWDGQSWSVSPSPTTQSIYSIWGSAPGDVYASDVSGTLLHWNGRGWSLIPGPRAGAFGKLWGSSANDIWSTTGEWTFHYDGAGWTQADAGSPSPLVWGRAANDVWFFGSTQVLHWDGAQFTPAMVSATPFLDSAWGPAANDIWATTTYKGHIAHWDGAAWSLMTTGTSSLLRGLTGHGHTTWIGGYWPGAVLYRPGRSEP